MRCKAGLFSSRTLSGEPPFSAVAMLLHMEGANNSTAIVDSSLSQRTIRRRSSAFISTEQSRFGSSSLKGGQGFEYEYTQAEAVPLVLGSANFTLEYFLRLHAMPGSNGYTLLYLYNISTYHDLEASLNSSGQLSLATYVGGTASASVAATIPLFQWLHVAIVREGSAIRLYLDGTQMLTLTTTRNFGNSTFYVSAGGTLSYVDEFRLTAGFARYPDGVSFTPPSSQFPDA
jgi:hypothetical protein